MASPTRSFPVTISRRPLSPMSLTPFWITPSSRSFSMIASSGHTAKHPPQLWQSSGNVRTVFPTTTMALNWQTSAHLPQRLHLLSSTSGTGVVTLIAKSNSGSINKWALGSSTSQSRRIASSPNTAARLVATVVLPVPPFPLATLMIILSTSHSFSSIYEIHLRNSYMKNRARTAQRRREVVS